MVIRPAVLDGYTITAGNANGEDDNRFGGGMYIYDGSPTLTNLTFTSNAALYHGGISNKNGSPVLTNCVFIGNVVEESGGGFRSYNGNPKLINCIFQENIARNSHGGGFYSYEDNERWE